MACVASKRVNAAAIWMDVKPRRVYTRGCPTSAPFSVHYHVQFAYAMIMLNDMEVVSTRLKPGQRRQLATRSAHEAFG